MSENRSYAESSYFVVPSWIRDGLLLDYSPFREYVRCVNLSHIFSHFVQSFAKYNANSLIK